MKKLFKKYKYEIILAIFVLVYILYFTTASFLKYDNFYTGRFDLGNMDQAVWNSIHGRIFQITDPNGTDIISRLAFHADFILVLISPLYLIWSNPKTLLLLQSIILALGSIFVYLIAKEVLKNKSLALILGIIFLLNPAVNYTNLYDFHPVTLGTTLLLATFYYFLKKKYFPFLVFAILSGLTKEHVWAIISIFGIAITVRVAFENRFKLKILNKHDLIEIIFGIFVFLASVFLFYYLIWHAIPAAHGGNHFALSYYSDFGNSASSITLNILFSPLKILGTIFQIDKIYYIFQLFLPLGFLSVFSPLILFFSGPDFAIDLLSNNNQLHEIYYQYTSTITPFLFIAAIYGLSFLKKKFPSVPNKAFITYLILATVISAYSFGPLPLAKTPSTTMFIKQLANKNVIDNFIESIPAKYSIAATNNIGSHLSRRQKIFTIPIGIDKADIILFLLNDAYAQPSLKAQKEMAKQMESDKNYIQIYKNGDFVVFEKRNLYLNKPKPGKDATNLFPFSLPVLGHREYIGSDINIEKNISSSKLFDSFIVSYFSDGLKQYVLMDIPNGDKPQNGFPVVIVNHGFIDLKNYSTTDSYKSICDYFASNGYLVLKPDFRGNGKSEVEEAPLMRFAYPIDVLNLIESLKNIPQANSNEIYLYGHSMGGEVTLKILEVAGKKPEILAKIKAAVVWAPVTNLSDWFNKSHVPWLQETKNNKNYYLETFKIMKTPEENPVLWQSVSPINYLSDIQTPVQINHGTSDETVSYRTSIELYDNLMSLNKTAELQLYPNNDHNLLQSWNKAAANSLIFFKKY